MTAEIVSEVSEWMPNAPLPLPRNGNATRYHLVAVSLKTSGDAPSSIAHWLRIVGRPRPACSAWPDRRIIR